MKARLALMEWGAKKILLREALVEIDQQDKRIFRN
jgi:hypothetical protein